MTRAWILAGRSDDVQPAERTCAGYLSPESVRQPEVTVWSRVENQLHPR